ncbi:hypothetical protein [Sorangium atrum]|uniref:hypothetical protein n=1 Tax=Sorangium atrum TaxID=2995308 RepID=UPI0023EF2088|nr:hypothetical protein [Sorangium aterium]
MALDAGLGGALLGVLPGIIRVIGRLPDLERAAVAEVEHVGLPAFADRGPRVEPNPL